MLGSPVLYLKGMRILMFQLSGFYCRPPNSRKPPSVLTEKNLPFRSVKAPLKGLGGAGFPGSYL